jgi:hypothetical protein
MSIQIKTYCFYVVRRAQNTERRNRRPNSLCGELVAFRHADVGVDVEDSKMSTSSAAKLSAREDNSAALLVILKVGYKTEAKSKRTPTLPTLFKDNLKQTVQDCLLLLLGEACVPANVADDRRALTAEFDMYKAKYRRANDACLEAEEALEDLSQEFSLAKLSDGQAGSDGINVDNTGFVQDRGNGSVQDRADTSDEEKKETDKKKEADTPKVGTANTVKNRKVRCKYMMDGAPCDLDACRVPETDHPKICIDRSHRNRAHCSAETPAGAQGDCYLWHLRWFGDFPVGYKPPPKPKRKETKPKPNGLRKGKGGPVRPSLPNKTNGNKAGMTTKINLADFWKEKEAAMRSRISYKQMLEQHKSGNYEEAFPSLPKHKGTRSGDRGTAAAAVAASLSNPRRRKNNMEEELMSFLQQFSEMSSKMVERFA